MTARVVQADQNEPDRLPFLDEEKLDFYPAEGKSQYWQ